MHKMKTFKMECMLGKWRKLHMKWKKSDDGGGAGGGSSSRNGCSSTLCITYMVTKRISF